MAVTLKDVAEKAGVSIGTASMALNNSDLVNEETCKKVQKVARELNYVPNARARALVKKSTDIIGLVVPAIINPFFAELAQAIKDTIKKEGYNLILCSTDGKPEEEARYINMFKSGQVDGAIFASQEHLSQQSYEMLEDLALNYIPVINIDSGDQDNKIPTLKSDLTDAAYQGTRHLIELGHEKIGYIGYSPRRLEGYKRALDEAGMLNSKYIYYSIENISQVVENIVKLEDRPTALFCYNDEIALNVIQLLVEKGFKIPEDISICGTDNIRLAKNYNPPLTTVNIPKEEMGKKAAEILLNIIDGKKRKEVNINYPTELIVRKSTCKI